MSDPCDPRARRVSLQTESRMFGIVVFTVVLLATGAIGLAQDSGDPSPDVSRPAKRHTTSNQSVSIDTPPSDVPAAPVEADASAEGQVGASSAPRAGRSEASTVIPRRTIRRRPAGESEETLLGERSTPWFRTGIGALTIVLVLVGLIYFLARRYVPSIRAADGGVLRVVTRTSLTSKQTLALIQLGPRFVMVAISPNRVDVLSEISDPDEVADLTARTGAAGPGGAQTFDNLLSREAEAFDVPEHTEQSTRRRSSGPVADLLTRLRSLQRSH